MTAKQVLNAKAGQKVGLGNGLRLICDKRDLLAVTLKLDCRSRDLRADESHHAHRYSEQYLLHLLVLDWVAPSMASIRP